MTTGPQHFAAAEHLLANAGVADPTLIARAQVHATLALAAATALATYSDGEMDARDYYAWHDVAGVKGEYTVALQEKAEQAGDREDDEPNPFDVADQTRAAFGLAQSEADNDPTPADVLASLRAVFTGPVEGRDYHEMPGAHLANADDHDPATCRECLDACMSCGSLNHHANDCEAEL